MNRLIVVADDLTGACDSAAYVADCGIKTEVVVDVANTPVSSGFSKAIIINTQTRTIDRERAYFLFKTTVPKVVKQYCEADTRICIFKKIDTAFRGNVGIEIQGMLEGLDIKTAFLISAIPVLDRITQKGHQIIEGRKIHLTDFSHDPINPVTHSYIPDIINHKTNLSAEGVELGESKTSRFLARIKNNTHDSAKVYVFDATIQSDIEQIVEQLYPNAKDCVWIGSLGLIQALVKKLYGARTSDTCKYKFLNGINPSGNIIGISGSAHARTTEQIKEAERQGILTTVVFDHIQATNYYNAKNELERMCQAVRSALKRFEFVCILPERVDPSQNSEDRKVRSIDIVSGLSEVARCIVQTAAISCLLLIGGETSYAVFKKLGVSTLIITGRIETAVVCGYFADPRSGKKISIIIKGGSVGDLDSIVNIYHYITKEQER